MLFLLSAIGGLLVSVPLAMAVTRYPKLLLWEEPLQHPDNGQPPAAECGNKNGFSLLYPGPCCLQCGHRFAPRYCLPLIGSMLLRQRCPRCHEQLPAAGIAVEFLYPLLCIACVWHFGESWQLLAAVLFVGLLLLLAAVDQQCLLLPDTPVMLLLWSGLLFNSFGMFVSAEAAIAGAIGGWLLLWLTFQSFLLLTGREGLGYGDFKLLAALGAWLGWQALPMILLIASCSAACWGLILIMRRRHHRQQPLPFGPWLAAAGILVLLSPLPIDKSLETLLRTLWL